MNDNGWKDPALLAPDDHELYLLLVDYGEGGGALEDDQFARTIGFRNAEDEWQFAGWDWCHDVFVQGTGKVIGYQEIPRKPFE